MHKERNDGGGKRTNVQGRPLDGTEIAKWSFFFLQGHDGEFTFMVKHGFHMGTSEAPRIFSWAFEKTFKRWKMSPQTPPSMMLSAPFTALRGSKVDGSWSGFADDLFIKDELPDHTAESANDIIVSNAASLDETLAEDRYHQNVRKLEIVPSILRYGRSLLERSLAGPGISEAATSSTEATKRKSSTDFKRWRRSGRRCEGFGLHVHRGATDV